MKIILGSDHLGFELKEIIKQHIQSKGLEVTDIGVYDKAPSIIRISALPLRKE
nr:RpiB/LacA/LacB family sugar-phosphate isomerase [Biomaibacter acetigenes]